MLLSEKNGIITGARRGIGRATVEVFAQNGANIWACARKPDKAFEADMKNLAEKYSVWIKPVYFEITEEGQVKNAIKEIISEKKSVDILANVAGVAHGGLLSMTSMKTIKEVFEINFFAQVLMMQLVSRCMSRQNSGSIVNVSSVAGIDSEPGYIAYGSSKAAIAFATKTVACELANYGIRVNAVAPGLSSTEMGNQIESGARDRMMNACSMERLGKPEEIANTIAFLASDKASFITGQVIRVDGGM